MSHEHDNHDHDHDHDHEDDALALELGAQGQIFLDMRQQNLELLQIAAKVAGYAGEHAPLKPGDLKQALRTIWDVYSEFYAWVDPEDTDEDGDDGDDEE